MPEWIFEYKAPIAIIIGFTSLIIKLFTRSTLLDFFLFQSKRKKEYLLDEIKSFNLIKDNVKDKNSIAILNKELDNKLLLRYLNIRFVSPKRMNKMLRLYNQNKELKNYTSVRSFMKYHSAFNNDGFFNNTASIFFTILFSFFALLFGFLAIYISIAQKNNEDSLISLSGFAFFYILLLPTIGNYGAKRRFNKILLGRK